MAKLLQFQALVDLLFLRRRKQGDRLEDRCSYAPLPHQTGPAPVVKLEIGSWVYERKTGPAPPPFLLVLALPVSNESDLPAAQAVVTHILNQFSERQQKLFEIERLKFEPEEESERQGD